MSLDIRRLADFRRGSSVDQDREREIARQRAEERERRRVIVDLAHQLAKHAPSLWVEMGEEARLKLMARWQAAHLRERGYAMQPKGDDDE